MKVHIPAASEMWVCEFSNKIINYVSLVSGNQIQLRINVFKPDPSINSFSISEFVRNLAKSGAYTAEEN